MDDMKTIQCQLYAIQAQLAAPFSPQQTHWKPQATAKDGASCLAACYIDARDVQDRLDDVMGIGGWRDEYELIPGEKVITCRLWLNLPGVGWIAKSDVGDQSQQPDAGDRIKAAYSDAIKRAAVKWGIGRYLYSVRPGWVPFDGQRKQIPDEANAKLVAAIERAIRAHRKQYEDYYTVKPNVVAPPPKDSSPATTASPPLPSEEIISDAEVNTLRGMLIRTEATDEETICQAYSDRHHLQIVDFTVLPRRFYGSLVKKLDEMIEAEVRLKQKRREEQSRAASAVR